MLRLIALPLLFAAATAAAEEPAAPARFVFVPVEQGTLRLDAATGEVSLCAGAADALACRPLPDEARGRAEEPSRIEERIDALEARIAALEESGTGRGEAADDEAMDRVMQLADRMMRRFFGMVRDMKRDLEREDL